MVGKRKMSVIERSRCKASLSRRCICTASSECPPRSKKLSRVPTCASFSTSFQMSAMVSSRSLVGATKAASAAGAVGDVGRTAAPCGRSCRWASAAGRRASRSATGTMNSGRRPRRCSRSSAMLIGVGAAGDEVGDQAQITGHVFTRHHHRLAHRRVRRAATPRSRRARCGSRGLHLVVEAAEELDHARRARSRARSPVR